MSDYTLAKAHKADIEALRNGSAFTFIGLNCDEKSLDALVADLRMNFPTMCTPIIIYYWQGSEFNNQFGLTGDNAYQPDVTFVSLPLENWLGEDFGKLAMYKMTVGARWLDDICDNNARREQEKGGYRDCE